MVLWEMVTDKLEKLLADVGFGGLVEWRVVPQDVSFVFISSWVSGFGWFELKYEIMFTFVEGFLVRFFGFVKMFFVAGNG